MSRPRDAKGPYVSASAQAVIDEAEVLPYDPAADFIPHVDGFTPITAYSIDYPNLSISYTTDEIEARLEAVDPDHRYRPNRPTIDFRWGAYLVTSPVELEVLKKKPGIYFENLPAGVAAPVCRKCRFSCRNQEAMIHHIEKM